MVFFSNSSFMGGLLEQSTIHITGSLVLTLLATFILLFGLMMMFRIPVNISIILILPLVLSFMAYQAGGFLAVGGVILMLVGVLLAKNWIIR